jgi:hypothetical protein
VASGGPANLQFPFYKSSFCSLHNCKSAAAYLQIQTQHRLCSKRRKLTVLAVLLSLFVLGITALAQTAIFIASGTLLS